MGDKKNILLVEDHLLTQHITQMLLETYDLDVKVAHTAEEALQQAQTQQFNFVMIDLGLPDGDGLEFITGLKLQQPNAQFIAITSCIDDRLSQEVCSKGCLALLEKPLTEHSFVNGKILHEFFAGI